MVQIPQHAHCQICGKAIQVEEKTCSPECARGLEAHQRKRKHMLYVLYAMIALMFVLLLFGQTRAVVA
ncbi:MAG TPA: DUF2116 family Zn-ribbon domain-containing protein [Candidatus Thermoplasmatota archaeon]|nr:DUF2116 family Zn-ribbon domain-containing protein [Candidatus Thermoplasmatota archaeon]